MKFVIVSHATLSFHQGKSYTYGPYAKEMNLWLKHVSEVIFVCPKEPFDETQLLVPLELPASYRHFSIPDFNVMTWKNRLLAIPAILVCLVQIFRGMIAADHIHLRTPGNIGLLGCLVQVLFPFKKKTAKYAGNWDWKSQQPFSYRLQQKILQNTFLTHNISVLVYGHWPNATKNILPFFTASYAEKDKVATPPRSLKGKIQFMFVGALVAGKQPMLPVQAIEGLFAKGLDVQLHIFGNGPFYPQIQSYISEKNLEQNVVLHGNQPASIVKEYFQQSHFLVFISKSEGWPKVVAESMFWGCLPITTAVSCVPEMVDYGKRGTLVPSEGAAVENAVMKWMQHDEEYIQACNSAMKWSREFTLEKFESEIVKLL